MSAGFDHDVAVIGAGAAGILAAIAARGAIDAKGGTPPPSARPAVSVALFDSMPRPGKKILISGGGKCNLTNERVTADDFEPRGSKRVRNILRELPPDAFVRWVESRGLDTFAEPLGKVFPRPPKRARDLLAVLLAAAEEAGVALRFGRRVIDVAPLEGGFAIRTTDAPEPEPEPPADPAEAGEPTTETVRRVIVATGGLSVPATGSTGFGFALARRVGHRVVTPRPALVGLTSARPAGLAGLTIPAILVARRGDRDVGRAAGSLLFTHRGASGPAALDASLVRARARTRARGPGDGDRETEGDAVIEAVIEADFWSMAREDGPWAALRDLRKPPGACLPDPPRPADPHEVEAWLRELARERPKATLRSALSERVPRGLVEAVLPEADARVRLGELRADTRKRAANLLTRLDLEIRGDEGFRKAEVTAGGVPLDELDRRTLESRVLPGLHFCGEVVDVTGRLGGFNFQWAWSSGFVAGRGAARGASREVGADPADERG